MKYLQKFESRNVFNSDDCLSVFSSEELRNIFYDKKIAKRIEKDNFIFTYNKYEQLIDYIDLYDEHELFIREEFVENFREKLIDDIEKEIKKGNYKFEIYIFGGDYIPLEYTKSFIETLETNLVLQAYVNLYYDGTVEDLKKEIKITYKTYNKFLNDIENEQCCEIIENCEKVDDFIDYYIEQIDIDSIGIYDVIENKLKDNTPQKIKYDSTDTMNIISDYIDYNKIIKYLTDNIIIEPKSFAWIFLKNTIYEDAYMQRTIIERNPSLFTNMKKHGMLLKEVENEFPELAEGDAMGFFNTTTK